jgi:hypothetical protein
LKVWGSVGANFIPARAERASAFRFWTDRWRLTSCRPSHDAVCRPQNTGSTRFQNSVVVRIHPYASSLPLASGNRLSQSASRRGVNLSQVWGRLRAATEEVCYQCPSSPHSARHTDYREECTACLGSLPWSTSQDSPWSHRSNISAASRASHFQKHLKCKAR